MSDELRLKPIHPEALAEAAEKAEQYRRLNEPGQAESICLDMLEVDPGNQDATRILILALTDKFARDRSSASAREVREYLPQLTAEYDQFYYAGIISEREAKALLGRGMASGFAYDGFREAMEWYEKAEKVRPTGKDDAILRWNSCVRAIRREGLKPRENEQELPLE